MNASSIRHSLGAGRSLAVRGTVLTPIVVLMVAGSRVMYAQQPIPAQRRQAALAAIERGYAQYIAAFASADAAGVAALYDEHYGARLEPNGRVIQGRRAIAASLHRFLDRVGPVKVALHTDDLWLLGGRAYETGRWSYTFAAAGRPAQTVGGQYVTVWIPQSDGSWRMGADLSVPTPPGDTTTVSVGAAFVDGRIYRPHVARVVRSVTRAGRITEQATFTNDLSIAQRDGSPVIVIRTQADSGVPDPTWGLETVLDRRTMALRHWAMHSARRSITLDVDGAHLTGSATRPDSGSSPIDLTLAEPAYLDGVLDATIGAVSLRPGLVLRVPTFGIEAANRRTTWRSFRVAGRDTVSIGGRRVPAWIVEGDAPTHDRIWLVDEPPYMTRWMSELPDHAVEQFDQTLISTHP